jgi:aspartokinase-like uncharacterized kinase
MSDPGHTPALRVIKVGGSLLLLPDLKQRIEGWLAKQTPARNLWIVGGGSEVDALRNQDTGSPAEATNFHWSAIEIMDKHAKRLADDFPSWQIETITNRDFRRSQTAAQHDIPNFPALELSPSANVILSATSWAKKLASRLPATWNVTSDSIAAAIAVELESDELVLMKSADPPPPATLKSLVDKGFVDAFFLEALKTSTRRNTSQENTNHAQPLRLKTVNLRTADFCELAID